jgi:hypothetical protein
MKSSIAINANNSFNIKFLLLLLFREAKLKIKEIKTELNLNNYKNNNNDNNDTKNNDKKMFKLFSNLSLE